MAALYLLGESEGMCPSGVLFLWIPLGIVFVLEAVSLLAVFSGPMRVFLASAVDSRCMESIVASVV